MKRGCTPIIMMLLMMISSVAVFAAQPIMSNTFGYAGQPLSAATHHIQLGGYRAYNPQQGVFLSRDSDTAFTRDSTHNGYNYATGNPLLYTDPSGHMSQLAWTLLGIGASLAMGLGSIYGGTEAGSFFNLSDATTNALSGSISNGLATATSVGLSNIADHKHPFSTHSILAITLGFVTGGLTGYGSTFLKPRSYLQMATYNAATNAITNDLTYAAVSKKHMRLSTLGLTTLSGGVMGSMWGLAGVHAAQRHLPSTVQEEEIELIPFSPKIIF